MPDTAAPSVFISYSREDSAFVDRLEADLRARGFRTWVDRRRLEGGQDWQAEIDRAIDQHAVMVLVLSPNSTNSPAVTHEYQYATTRNKQVLPVLLQECTPHYTIPQQWIEDFLRRDYATGLNALLGTLLFQQLSLTAPSRELYERATALKGRSQVGDKEQAAVILQRILDRDPGYLQGLVKGDLDQLTQSLYPSRAQNLRQQVIAARKTGEYGVEASALEALLALGHADPCATEYLPLARQNSQFVDLYWVVQQQAAKGALPDARDKLQFLWSKAPYYRDPANVAPKLGLTLPRSYEEVKAREGAEEQRRREEAAAKAELAQKTGDENAIFQRLHDQMEAGYSSSFSESAQENIARSLKTLDASPTLSETADEVVNFTNRRAKALSESIERGNGRRRVFWLVLTGSWTFLFVSLLLWYIFLLPLQNDGPAEYAWTFAYQLSIDWPVIIVYLILILPVAPIFLVQLSKSRRIHRAKSSASYLKTKRDSWYQQWKGGAQQEIDIRIQRLQATFDKRKQDIISDYTQRLQAIEVAYRTHAPIDPLLACWEHAKAG